MANPAKLGLILILSSIVVYLGLKILVAVSFGLLSLLVPIAIVGGIGLILYGLINPKALRGGGRSLP